MVGIWGGGVGGAGKRAVRCAGSLAGPGEGVLGKWRLGVQEVLHWGRVSQEAASEGEQAAHNASGHHTSECALPTR